MICLSPPMGPTIVNATPNMMQTWCMYYYSTRSVLKPSTIFCMDQGELIFSWLRTQFANQDRENLLGFLMAIHMMRGSCIIYIFTLMKFMKITAGQFVVFVAYKVCGWSECKSSNKCKNLSKERECNSHEHRVSWKMMSLHKIRTSGTLHKQKTLSTRKGHPSTHQHKHSL